MIDLEEQMFMIQANEEGIRSPLMPISQAVFLIMSFFKFDYHFYFNFHI